MPNRQPFIRFAFFIVLGSTGAMAAEPPATEPAATQPAATRPAARSATLSVAVDGPLVSEFPVLLKITFRNTGPGSLHYWCGGPARYPQGTLFRATIIDGDGKPRRMPLSNGQYEQGSGSGVEIQPGDSVELPAAGDPLPPGRYTLTVTGRADGHYEQGKLVEAWPASAAEPIVIDVADDPKKRAAAERALVDKATDDPFARHVAVANGFHPDVRRWLVDAASADLEVAKLAIGQLQHVRRLPPGDDLLLLDAALKQAGRGRAAGQPVPAYLSQLAGRVRTDAALAAVLAIVNSDVEWTARDQAARELGRFDQPRAEKALLAFADDPKSPLHGSAIATLARQGNPAVLATVLAAAADPAPTRRNFAYVCLGGLKAHPQARAALERAVREENNPESQAFAERALAGTSWGEQEQD